MNELNPRKAEHLLADAGVFKGHEGLRGLAEAAAFWARQEYGTRLYYGEGANDYLHRGVLQCAVKALDAAAADLDALRAEVARLTAKLAKFEEPLTLAQIDDVDVAVGGWFKAAPSALDAAIRAAREGE